MRLVLSNFQDQLVRGLSHRMNNILSLFHGYLGLLMEDAKLNAVTREGLRKIRKGAREAAELIERTNAISRPASDLRREVNLAAFLRQVAPSFDALHGPKVQIAIECPEDLPRVPVEPSRMKLALIELVRNACEADASKVTIRATAIEDSVQAELFPGTFPPAHGQWVKIEVTGNGTVIPISDANRIYEPFYSTKKTRRCPGLGLAVALGCAQQSGGNLCHRSNEGETTFEMLLPACAQQPLSAVA